MAQLRYAACAGIENRERQEFDRGDYFPSFQGNGIEAFPALTMKC